MPTQAFWSVFSACLDCSNNHRCDLIHQVVLNRQWLHMLFLLTNLVPLRMVLCKVQHLVPDHKMAHDGSSTIGKAEPGLKMWGCYITSLSLWVTAILCGKRAPHTSKKEDGVKNKRLAVLLCLPTYSCLSLQYCVIKKNTLLNIAENALNLQRLLWY